MTTSDLGPRGTRLWASVTDRYDLRADELEILEEACRTLDLIDELRAAIAEAVDDSGDVAPAVKELRLQRAELRHQLAQLGVADDSAMEPGRSRSARKAANTRWRMADKENE